MALDVGTKTIGIAISDPLRMFPQPHSTLSREGVRKDVDRLAPLARSLDVSELVVGLPLELDGTESRSARLARQVGEALGTQLDMRPIYIDERFSSVEAERWLLQADLSRKRRKEVIDQAAAVVILRSYLDHGDWTRDADSGEGA